MLCNHIYVRNVSGSTFRAGKITNRKRISREAELVHHKENEAKSYCIGQRHYIYSDVEVDKTNQEE